MPQRHKVTKFHQEDLNKGSSLFNSLCLSAFVANIFKEYNLK